MKFSALVFFVLLVAASSSRGNCKPFDKTLQMKASSHFLHESDSARRICIDIVSIISLIVGNKLIFECQDDDESGGRMLFV